MLSLILRLRSELSLRWTRLVRRPRQGHGPRRCFDYLIIGIHRTCPPPTRARDTYLEIRRQHAQARSAVLVPYRVRRRPLGLVPTLSVSEYPPHLLARLVNTLDHVTEGRDRLELRHRQQRRRRAELRPRQALPHDERYEVADEFADPVTKLWEAWNRCPSCSTARTTFRRRQQGPCGQPRRQVLQVPRSAQRAALAAGPRADLPRPAARRGRPLRRQWADTSSPTRRPSRGDEGLPRG